MKHLIIITLFICGNYTAQDFHFSQFNKTQLLLNPARTGFCDGYERFAVHHRSQWIGSGTQFFTTAATAEMTLGKEFNELLPYLGLGVHFLNDVGGLSKISTTTGGLNLSGILPINYLNSFSAGIQVAYANRSADLSRLTYPSQWSGTQYDPSIISGEIDQFNSVGYVDASAGVFYRYGKNQTKVIREKDLSFEIGLSAFHLNRPKMRYNTGTQEPIDIKLIGMANVYFTVTEITGLEFNVMQAMQGKHLETNLGFFMKNRFNDASRSTSHSHDSFIGYGFYVRTSGMIIPAIQFDWRDFQFGFSYDVMVSRMRKAYPGGSFELTLSYRTRGKSLFKPY